MTPRPSELLDVMQNGLFRLPSGEFVRLFDVREKATGKLVMIGTSLEVMMRTGIVALEMGKLN